MATTPDGVQKPHPRDVERCYDYFRQMDSRGTEPRYADEPLEEYEVEMLADHLVTAMQVISQDRREVYRQLHAIMTWIAKDRTSITFGRVGRPAGYIALELKSVLKYDYKRDDISARKASRRKDITLPINPKSSRQRE